MDALELDKEELEGVPNPGDVVVEKYRVERVLGVGGMGCVVAATHTSLDTQVAIKFLLAKAAKNPSNIERFKREAQAAARIKSDHVAKVTDIGTLENGTPYMIMEFLDGEDLSDRLLRGGVAIPEACRYILQACEALAEAHKAGIVHRDLKPANLFLTPHPSGDHRIKVLDFGISKIIAEPGMAPGADLTKTSTLMGSPLYMSPEQMMSAKDADARADIWALGVILHELITGMPPFIGGSLPEVCSKILTAPPPPLAQALPGAPPTLAAILTRALAKKPDERYPTLAELAVELAPFAGPDGQRSADVVCRVLGRTPGTPSGVPSTAPGHPVGLTTKPGMAPPDGHAGQNHAGQSHPGQGHITTHPGAHTGPEATAPTQISNDGGTLMSPEQVQAMAAGAHTAAPVAQTYDGSEPKRPRRALFAAALFGIVLVLAAAVGLVRNGRRRAAAAEAAEAAAAAETETSEADASETEEPSAQERSASPDADESDGGGDASEDTPATTPTSTPNAQPKLPRPSLRPTARPSVMKPPPPPPPNEHEVKKGDDLFN